MKIYCIIFFIASFGLLSADPQNASAPIEKQESPQISIREFRIYEEDSRPDYAVVISWGLEKPTGLILLISKDDQEPGITNALVITPLLLIEDMQWERGADPFSTPKKLVGWTSSFMVDKSLKDRIYIGSKDMRFTNLQNLIEVHPTKYEDPD